MVNTRPIVSITFDDCPRSAVVQGATILERHKANGTFYICGSLAGTRWENGPQYQRSDLPRLLAAGHEVGCHTYSHLDCAHAESHRIEQELSANRDFLARAAPGVRSETFAYPYGSISLTAKRVAQAHFKACRGVEAGINVGRADLGLLRAVPIPSGDAVEATWIDPWLAQIREQCGWLILYTHDIVDTPTPYGCRPSLLNSTVSAIRSAGIDIMTVADAARAITSRP